MRPTLLNFRSPKEKTPFYFDPKNTYDGRVLSFSSPKGSGKTSTFSNEKRFTWYKKIQGSTYGIGPGSYSPIGLRNGKERITSGSPYRQLHAIKDYANEHLMVGDQIVVNNDFSASGKERSGFGSEHKFSTKQSSLDLPNTIFNRRKLTPDPVFSRKYQVAQAKFSRPVVGFFQKHHDFVKIEKLLKKRFKFISK